MKVASFLVLLSPLVIGGSLGCRPAIETKDTGSMESNSPEKEQRWHSLEPGSVSKVRKYFGYTECEVDGQTKFETEIGSFDLKSDIDFLDGSDVPIETDEELCMLQILGGKEKQIVLELDPSLKLPSVLRIGCQRINKEDSAVANIFYIESSSGNDNWMRCEVLKSAEGMPTYPDWGNVRFRIPADAKKIRFVGNTKPNEEFPHGAGVAFFDLEFTAD